MFTHAIVRKPGPNFHNGLTTSTLGKPKFDLLLQQHQVYIQTLEELGLRITVLDAQPDYPDAYFVEDTAVVTPEVAIITIPGAPARQGEQHTIQAELAKHRTIASIIDPGRVDGGDVLMVGRHFFVGISGRTNSAGAQQLGIILESVGYTWSEIPVGEGLHLKSSINYVGDDTLLLTSQFAELKIFKEYAKIVLAEADASAANTLWINDTLIVPRGFPRVSKALIKQGLPIIELDVSEMAKMDGGLTCMSLRF
jgi:dimethylargininase